jgi:asparagine synthase (glutamine-hydrolysing)
MCGVNLVINNPVYGERAIRNMMEATRHRGPDHSAWMKVTEGSYLAGNRLKTLDLNAAANQPLTDEEKTVFLVWNGFLYNYQDLRNELLDQGDTFRTKSDGEVLLKWLKRFGAKGMSRLQGMFALAFVDKVKQEAIIARDPVGMKSLYYTHINNQLCCSSEVKAIQKSVEGVASFNESQALPYFYFRHAMPSESFIRGIKELLPGKVRSFDLQGRLKEERDLGTSTAFKKSGKSGDFQELLTDAVLKHFHADVPVGLILSGGADSALLYHTWYKETGIPIPTFTAVFGDKYKKKFQDGRFAEKLVNKYHGHHQQILITPEKFLANWPAYIGSLDQPVGDSAGFLTWMIAKRAGEDVKILVSGAGADELFGGYNRHKVFRYYLKYPKYFKLLSSFAHPSWPMGRSTRKLLASLDPDPGKTFMNFAALSPLPAALGNSMERYYPSKEPAYKAALQWDRSFYLINDILKIHDNACMVHGIEGRAPYLDWPLINLSEGLDEKKHLEMPPKFWIKGSLEKAGLGFISKRKKLGFGIPIREWMKDHEPFRKAVFSSVTKFEQQYTSLVPEEWRTLLKRPHKFAGENYLLLYNIFLLSDWLKENDL